MMNSANRTQNRLTTTRAHYTKKLTSLGLTLIVISTIAVSLGLRVYLMLYFPGTEETRSLFNILLPHWGGFSQFTLLLKMPSQIIVDFAQPYIPAIFLPYLTDVPAAQVMDTFFPDPEANYAKRFPGEMEWLSLWAIPLWTGFLLSAYSVFWFLVETKDAIANAPYETPKPQKARDEQPARQSVERLKQNPRPTQNHPTSSQAAPSRPTDPKTKDRLSQTKGVNLAAPPLRVDRPRSGTLSDWEAHKAQEGDMMVRHMISELQKENRSLHVQQAELRSTFSQYFSPNVLEYLETNRARFENVQNEKRQVSVLFCDIRGFSAYSQTATPDELVRFLDEYFEIASYIILHKYDGVINKLMGDGLLAYWGFPVPHNDHAYVATCAALDIQKEIDLRNRTTNHPTPLNVGIGIATGDAVVGNIGSSDFKDFTLLGVPVNLATRLDEANKQLKTSILISANTYAGLQGRLACEDKGAIEIRGWQGTEHVFAPQIEYVQTL